MKRPPATKGRRAPRPAPADTVPDDEAYWREVRALDVPVRDGTWEEAADRPSWWPQRSASEVAARRRGRGASARLREHEEHEEAADARRRAREARPAIVRALPALLILGGLVVAVVALVQNAGLRNFLVLLAAFALLTRSGAGRLRHHRHHSMRWLARDGMRHRRHHGHRQ